MAIFESPEILESMETVISTSHSSSDRNLFSFRLRTTTVTAAAGTSAPDTDDSGNGEAVDNRDRVESANLMSNVGEKANGIPSISDIRFTYRPCIPLIRGSKKALSSLTPSSNRSGFRFRSRSLSDWPLFMCCHTLPIFPLAAFVVEKLVQQNYISEPFVVFLHVIISSTAVLYPVIVILRCDSAFLSGVALMLFACILWLKLVSYAHTTNDMRALAKSAEMGNVAHSYDVSFRSLVYFMVAPTLCYQTSYPRTRAVQKSWVVHQFIKFIIFTGLMRFITEQYVNPVVQNSQHPLKGNLLYAIELNILAELLHFGDREFYRDWWNAKAVGEYWRMWNMPVHKWMVRHVYFPCSRNGMPKGVAIIITFLVSAVFHELCIAVPSHIFKLWAFIGMMFQVPLVVITNFLQNKFRSATVGSMIFWFIFSILGQPMCVLLCYHDLMNRKGKAD